MPDSAETGQTMARFTRFPTDNGLGRRTMTDEVVDFISARVRDGAYRVGDKLPNEEELAREIGVGRSSVREGMKILKVYGLVEIRQGGGTFVADDAGKHMFDFLWYMSGSTYENFIDFRRELEIGSIATICGRLTKQDFAELQTLNDLIDYRNDLDDIVQADRSFHKKITNFYNNPLQEQIENMLYRVRLDVLYKTLCHRSDVELTQMEHQRILDALKNEDVIGAIEAANRHLDSAYRKVSADEAGALMTEAG